MKKFFEQFGCGMEKTIQQVKEEKERVEKIQEILKSEKSPLQDYVNENILSTMNAQKIANLICQQMTLVSLVRKMRDAQKAYENAPKKTMEDIDALETYIFEMLEAEKKVDNLLKNIEEII